MRPHIVLILASATLSMTACSLVTPVASADDSVIETAVAWDDALDHVGTNQRVCGPLVRIGHDQDDVFVNIGYDYPDPQRFTIVVWDVGSIDEIAAGSTVCATGEITSYDGVAEIELRSTDLIEVL